jgi:hypothetical protein
MQIYQCDRFADFIVSWDKFSMMRDNCPRLILLVGNIHFLSGLGLIWISFVMIINMFLGGGLPFPLCLFQIRSDWRFVSHHHKLRSTSLKSDSSMHMKRFIMSSPPPPVKFLYDCYNKADDLIGYEALI